MKYLTKQQATDLIIDFGRRLYEKNMVAANDGNLSVKIGDNAVLITPSGVSKGFLTPEMLVVVDLENNLIEGNFSQSSETKMHLQVYKNNLNIGGVAHAHPVFATAFAAAGLALDQPVLTESVIGLGKIPLAPFATPGTEEVPQSIVPFLNNYKGVLLANHGVLTWGKDLMQAFFRMESIEHTAKIQTICKYLLKSDNQLNAEQLAKLAPFIGRFD